MPLIGGEGLIKIKRPVNIHKSYHAHLYFDETTLGAAKNIGMQASEIFGLKVGRVHEKCVGPHTKWSCQIAFANKHFDKFIPWLDANRLNLSVFVHALTGNDLDDHTKYAYWLGDSVELDLSVFNT